jgi:WD40 repeat protein
MKRFAIAAGVACVALLGSAHAAQNAPALEGLKAGSIPDQPKELLGILGKPEEYSGDGRHQIHGIGFSPEGDLLGVAAGTLLRLWDLSGPSPKEAGTMEAAVGRGAGWAFSPDGKSVAVATRKSVVFWDLSQRPPKKKSELAPESLVSTLSFAPDGSVLAAGSRDRVELWDLQAETRKARVLQGHAKTVDRVTFSPSGKLLASGAFSEAVRLWDPLSGQGKNILKGQGGSGGHVWCLLFSPDEERLVVTSNAPAERGKLRLWNLAGEPKEAILKEHTDWIRSVVFTPDGSRMISMGGDGEIVRWNAAEGRKLDRWKLPGESLEFHAMALSPDGRTVAVLHKDTRIYILRPAP